MSDAPSAQGGLVNADFEDLNLSASLDFGSTATSRSIASIGELSIQGIVKNKNNGLIFGLTGVVIYLLYKGRE